MPDYGRRASLEQGLTFTALSPNVVAILRCPLCKARVNTTSDVIVCVDCGSSFAHARTDTGAGIERVVDFRLARGHLRHGLMKRWDETQAKYDEFTNEHAARDDLYTYLTEIDSVTEIYSRFFSLEGDILDVGGHQGRLRHFISPAGRQSYVSADPYLRVFERIAGQRALLEAYPALNEPCNFVCCHAEHLPFAPREFDCVHMRSVLDHFYDPYLALKEAYRVLRPGGRILVGLTVVDPPVAIRASPPVTRLLGEFLSPRSAAALARHAVAKIKYSRCGYHMTQWRRGDVRDALRIAGFESEEEHWQKPPYSMCLYVSAQRPA